MSIWNGIYLGLAPLIDPTEGNTLAENASALVGLSFGGPGNALAGNLTEVQTFDTNGNSALDQNNATLTEVFTADIGNGVQSFNFDAVVAVSATITYLDGSTVTTTVVILQSTPGPPFLAPGLTATANAPLIAGPIQSLTINSVVTDSALGLATTRPTINFVACFAAGTLIRTDAGSRPVEHLCPGDRVWTRDAGYQPLRWTGARVVDGTGALAPVRFARLAIGNRRPLVVSPQHRMLLSGWRAELYLGEPEVLVAAVHLVNGDTIHRAPVERVSYHHILFDRHHLVEAEGILSESLFPGAEVRRNDTALWAELVGLFPELDQGTGPASYPLARPEVRGIEGRLVTG
ncbi:MAG: Hint domain-containing protein [Rubellimicrobium sp.]|nr:Hint domain-containing protein [Rubellimicrobium sp.]